jgi:uncharacterized protein (TIGR03437 family)
MEKARDTPGLFSFSTQYRNSFPASLFALSAGSDRAKGKPLEFRVRVFTLHRTYQLMMLRYVRNPKVGAATFIATLFCSALPLSGQSVPVVTAIANAASDAVGPIAPGEIVTVYGSGLGPAQLTPLSSLTAGGVATQLGGTQVFFNGNPAPVLYTWGSAVSVIVPYETTGASAQVTVTYLGRTSAAIDVPVAPSAPAIFVWGPLPSGEGQALAVNPDGSINSTENPAPVGSVITLYATGEGQTSPAGADGKVAASPAPQPILPVSVSIGGQTIKPLYAGGAPGEVAGVMQINVRIPVGVQEGGAVPISLQVGNASGQTGVRIAVTGNPVVFGDAVTAP